MRLSSLAVLVCFAIALVAGVTAPGKIPAGMNKQTTSRAFVDEFTGYTTELVTLGNLATNLLIVNNNTIESGVTASTSGPNIVQTPGAVSLSGTDLSFSSSGLSLVSTGGSTTFQFSNFSVSSSTTSSFSSVDASYISHVGDIALSGSTFGLQAETSSVTAINNLFLSGGSSSINTDNSILAHGNEFSLSASGSGFIGSSSENVLMTAGATAFVEGGDISTATYDSTELSALHGDLILSAFQQSYITGNTLYMEGLQGVNLTAGFDPANPFADGITIDVAKSLVLDANRNYFSSQDSIGFSSTAAGSSVNVKSLGTIQSNTGTMAANTPNNITLTAPNGRVGLLSANSNGKLTLSSQQVNIGGPNTPSIYIDSASAGSYTATSGPLQIQGPVVEVGSSSGGTYLYTPSANTTLQTTNSDINLNAVLGTASLVADTVFIDGNNGVSLSSQRDIYLFGNTLNWDSFEFIFFSYNSFTLSSQTTTVSTTDLSIAGKDIVSIQANQNQFSGPQFEASIDGILSVSTNTFTANVVGFSASSPGDIAFSTSGTAALSSVSLALSTTTTLQDNVLVQINNWNIVSPLTFSTGAGVEWIANTHDLVSSTITFNSGQTSVNVGATATLSSTGPFSVTSQFGSVLYNSRDGSGTITASTSTIAYTATTVNNNGPLPYSIVGQGGVNFNAQTKAGGGIVANAPNVNFYSLVGRDDQESFTFSTSASFSSSSANGAVNVEGPLQLSTSKSTFSTTGSLQLTGESVSFSTAQTLSINPTQNIDIGSDLIGFTSNNINILSSSSTQFRVDYSNNINANNFNISTSTSFISSNADSSYVSTGGFEVSSTDLQVQANNDVQFNSESSITFDSQLASSLNAQFDLYFNAQALSFEYSTGNIATTNEFFIDSPNINWVSAGTETLVYGSQVTVDAQAFSTSSILPSTFNVNNTATFNGGSFDFTVSAGTLVMSSNFGGLYVESSPANPNNLNDYDVTYTTSGSFEIFAEYFSSIATGLNETYQVSTSISSTSGDGTFASNNGAILVTGDQGINIIGTNEIQVLSSSNVVVYSSNGANSFIGTGSSNIISAQSPGNNVNSGSVVFSNPALAGFYVDSSITNINTLETIILTGVFSANPLDSFIESPSITYSAGNVFGITTDYTQIDVADLININAGNYLQVSAGNNAFFKTRSQNLSPSPISIQVGTIVQNNGDVISAANVVQSFSTGDLSHIAQQNYIVQATNNIDYHAGNDILFESTALNYVYNANNNLIFDAEGDNGEIVLTLGTSVANVRNYNTVGYNFNTQIFNLINVNIGGSFLATNTNPNDEIISYGNITNYNVNSNAITSVIVEGRFVTFDANNVIFEPLIFNIGANNVLQNPVFVVDASAFTITSSNDVTLTSTNSLAQYFVSGATDINSNLLTVNSNGDLFVGSLSNLAQEKLTATVGNFSVTAAALFEIRGYNIDLLSNVGSTYNINGKGVSDGLYIASENNLHFEGQNLVAAASQNFQNSAYNVQVNSFASTFTVSALDPVKRAGSLILNTAGAVALSAASTSISTTKNNGKISFITQNAQSSIILNAVVGSLSSTSGGSTNANANYLTSSSLDLQIIGTLPNTGYIRFTAANNFVVSGTTLTYETTNFELTSGSDFNAYTQLTSFTSSDSLFLQTQNGDAGNIYVIGYSSIEFSATSPNYANLVSADGNLNFIGSQAITGNYGSYLADVTGFVDSYTLGITSFSAAEGDILVNAQNAAVEFETTNFNANAQGNINFYADNGFSLTSTADSSNIVSTPGISMTTTNLNANAQAASIITDSFTAITFGAPDGIFTAYGETGTSFQFQTTYLGADIFFGNGINDVNINDTMTVNVVGFGEGFGTVSFIFTEVIAIDQPLSGIGVAANLVELYASGDVLFKSREATISASDIVVTANGGITISRSGGDTNYELIELVSFYNGDISFQTQYGGEGAIILSSSSSNVITYASYKTRFLNYNGGIAFSATGSLVVFSERNDEFPGIIFTTAAPININTDEDAVLKARNINYISTGANGIVSISGGSKLNAIVNFQLSNAINAGNYITAGNTVNIADQSGPFTINVLTNGVTLTATSSLNFLAAGNLHYHAYAIAITSNVYLTNIATFEASTTTGVTREKAVAFLSSRTETSNLSVPPAVIVGGGLSIPYVGSITNHQSCPYNRQIVTGINTFTSAFTLCVCEDNVFTCSN